MKKIKTAHPVYIDWVIDKSRFSSRRFSLPEHFLNTKPEGERIGKLTLNMNIGNPRSVSEPKADEI